MQTIRLAIVGAALSFLPALTVAQPRWALREDLRIGSADEGPTLFSDIRGIAVGERGALFVLDFRAQEIRMFDARGQFVKRVARKGAGPGEIQNANGMQMAPDGTIWVNDPANARFSVFSGSGEFVRQHTIPIWGYAYIWDAMIDAHGIVHEWFPVRDAKGTSTPSARRFNPGTNRVDTIPLPTCASRVGDIGQQVFIAKTAKASSNYGMPFLATPIHSWDARGFTWCSSRDRYEVLQLDLAKGDTVLRIQGKGGAVPVSKAERDSAIDFIRQGFRRLGVPEPDFGRVPTTKPMLMSLDPDGRGSVWVRRVAEPNRATLDIWDARGKLQATVTAPFPFSPYRRLLIRGDTVYTVVTDADDVPYVIRALLVR